MKLLIISHNCINTNNNMGRAMLSILGSFKNEELCQLYIYPTIPDIDRCNSYFRITDKECLKSIFNFKKCGHIIDKKAINSDNSLFEDKNDIKIYRAKKNIVRKVGRDIIWKLSNNFNDNMKKWLDEEKPTHILVLPGSNCFFYDLALKVKNYLNVPLITFFCDNYFNLETKNVLEKANQNRVNNKIEKIIQNSVKVFTISEYMSNYYKKYFNKEIDTLMLCSKITLNNKIKSKKIENISYMGNFSYKRYLNLADIGNTLDKINKKHNTNYKLNIYGELSMYDKDTIIETFQNIKSISLKGFVKGEKFKEALSTADMFVHVESFDKECIKLVKYSVSTKISENITTGKCLLAYGPDNVASINFLKSNNAAYVINSKEKLENELYKILTNYDLRSKIINNGIKAADKYLNLGKNCQKLYNCIKSIK